MSKIDTAIRTDILKKTCVLLNVRVFEFAPKCFRLQKPLHPTIDVYPKSLRTFNHEDQGWGDITDLEKFLKYQFS